MTAAITFQNVSKKFNGTGYYAVEHLSFSVDEGEFVTILGSSGCGKTTLLKMINRLHEPDQGSIFLFGQDTTRMDVVKLRRGIGYVIQETGLFPHMTIAQNVASVPRLLKWDKTRIDTRVGELLKMVGLDPDEFQSRYPSQLSGGQQQRVGLARALAVEPEVMLLDEPFGAVDAITRRGLQKELLQIHKGVGKTFLLVTHDINEAFKMGTKVMIMNEGKICQYDSPENIIRHPADPFTASLIGSAREQEKMWEGFAWKE